MQLILFKEEIAQSDDPQSARLEKIEQYEMKYVPYRAAEKLLLMIL